MPEAIKPHGRRLVQLRIVEAMREIGILLMAFSPLDVALGSKPLAESARILAAFLLVGLVLFVLSLLGERSLNDDGWHAGRTWMHPRTGAHRLRLRLVHDTPKEESQPAVTAYHVRC